MYNYLHVLKSVFQVVFLHQPVDLKKGISVISESIEDYKLTTFLKQGWFNNKDVSNLNALNMDIKSTTLVNRNPLCLGQMV